MNRVWAINVKLRLMRVDCRLSNVSIIGASGPTHKPRLPRLPSHDSPHPLSIPSPLSATRANVLPSLMSSPCSHIFIFFTRFPSHVSPHLLSPYDPFTTPRYPTDVLTLPSFSSVSSSSSQASPNLLLPSSSPLPLYATPSLPSQPASFP